MPGCDRPPGRVLAGLDMAQELLTQAGYLDGDIILITDGIEQQQQSL